jgi:hypothetical protein
LVGPEARAAGAPEAPDRDTSFSRFSLSPRVHSRSRRQPVGAMPQVGDHDARIVAQLASGMHDHFRLDDRPPRMRPAARLVACVAEHTRRGARRFGLGPRLGQPRGRHALQDGVLRHGGDILNPAASSSVEDRRRGEAAIHPDPNAGAGNAAHSLGISRRWSPRTPRLAGACDPPRAALAPPRRAITRSATASPRRYGARALSAFSDREIVGCDARRRPSIGSRSSSSFWIGSSARPSASLPSAYPQAIPKTRCARMSAHRCRTRGCRTRVVQRLAQRRRQAERAVRRIHQNGPPSELACAWSKATVGACRRGPGREQSVVSCRRATKRLRRDQKAVWQRLSTTRGVSMYAKSPIVVKYPG